MLCCSTHSDDQEDVVGLVLLGRGLAGHGDRSVKERGEVGRSVQLHLAQGELVCTKDALHTGVHVVLFVNKACFEILPHLVVSMHVHTK